MTATPNTVGESLLFMRQQHKNPTKSWKGRCQELFRTALGQDQGKYGSAYQQWLNTPDDRKHVGGNPNHAPIGSGLCFKGKGPNGHIMEAARPFSNGTQAAWSNDLVRPGKVDKVHRDAPIKIWGMEYLGYITNVNDKDIVRRI
jgi:hypothetical protein